MKIKNNTNYKIHFMTFGGGNLQFHEAVDRLIKQASSFNIFDNLHGFTDYDLKNDTEFWNIYNKFISKNTRFYGYAIWKAYLIKKS